jgi:hypothetical protein
MAVENGGADINLACYFIDGNAVITLVGEQPLSGFQNGVPALRTW